MPKPTDPSNRRHLSRSAMASEERRREERAARVSSILDAAERVLATATWEALTFEQVAIEARVSRPLVYQYFPDRECLFAALCQRALEDLRNSFASARLGASSGLQQLVAIGRDYARFAQQKTTRFELIAHDQNRQGSPSADPPAPGSLAAAACLQELAMAIGTGIQDGSIRQNAGDPRVLAIQMWAFTHGLIQISRAKSVFLERLCQMPPGQVIEDGLQFLADSLRIHR